MNIKLPMMWRQCARGSVDVVQREWQTNTKSFPFLLGIYVSFSPTSHKAFYCYSDEHFSDEWEENGGKNLPSVWLSSWECTCFHINVFFLLIGGCSNMVVARSGASHFPPFSLNLETLCNAMDDENGEAFAWYTQFTTQITNNLHRAQCKHIRALFRRCSRWWMRNVVSCPFIVPFYWVNLWYPASASTPNSCTGVKL